MVKLVGPISLLIAGLAIPSVSYATLLINGSFEDGLSGWSSAGFDLTQSYTDGASVAHTPTDGLNMLSVTDRNASIAQDFLFTGVLPILSFDRNLVDPVFPLNRLAAFAFHTTVRDENDGIVFFDIFPTPPVSNSWETVSVEVDPQIGDFLIGEHYRLSLFVSTNFVICVGEPSPICGAQGRGTALIDNITLTTVPSPPTSWLFLAGLVAVGAARINKRRPDRQGNGARPPGVPRAV